MDTVLRQNKCLFYLRYTEHFRFVKDLVLLHFHLNKTGNAVDKHKVENVMVKGDTMLSEHDYLFGMKRGDSKIIDVKSN